MVYKGKYKVMANKIMANSPLCHNHKIYLVLSKLLFFIYHPFHIQGDLQFKTVILLNIIPLKTRNFHMS